MQRKVIECPVCGKRFIRETPRQIYCSVKCRTKVMNARKKKKKAAIKDCEMPMLRRDGRENQPEAEILPGLR